MKEWTQIIFGVLCVSAFLYFTGSNSGWASFGWVIIFISSITLYIYLFGRFVIWYNRRAKNRHRS